MTRNHAFVFAKGTLADAGFAWKVVGSVYGYAANVVVSQSPAGGTHVAGAGGPDDGSGNGAWPSMFEHARKYPPFCVPSET